MQYTIDDTGCEAQTTKLRRRRWQIEEWHRDLQTNYQHSSIIVQSGLLMFLLGDVSQAILADQPDAKIRPSRHRKCRQTIEASSSIQATTFPSQSGRRSLSRASYMETHRSKKSQGRKGIRGNLFFKSNKMARQCSMNPKTGMHKP